LPWRQGVEDKGGEISDSLKAIAQGQQQILEELRKDKQVAPPVVAPPVEKESLKDKFDAKKEEIKDALLESPFLKHLVVIVLCVGGFLLCKAVYTKCHADKAKIDEDLKNAPVLKDLFDKVDSFNTSVHDKLETLKTKVEAKVNPPATVAPDAAPVAPVAK
jgi:methyl coenzyme M reductase subunit C-like uncharacterized protein (methanogenesis marker protein 7)